MVKFPDNNFVFLETNRFDKDNRRSYLFRHPAAVISCYRSEDVKDSFSTLEGYISKGYYAAGFICYEAGFSFEDTLKGLAADSRFPLLWFGIYKKPSIFTHSEKIDFLHSKDSRYSIKNLRPNLSRQRYVDNIKKIKASIRCGDTYQVNYTFKYKFDFSGSVYGLYEDLKRKQSVSYSALIKTPEFSVVSLSPELFFRKNNRCIEVRPMKGTIERGKDLEGDRRNREALSESRKDRSENVMIVDLLRNDLGRISATGTVKTEKLFEVEQYETLLQMISIVRGCLRKNLTLYDLFKAIFPSGSVTGAPKISTMKIISSLEDEPRRVYTGSIGFFAPSGETVFNVAIRTLLINNKTKTGEMGVGSGIVYDSAPQKEFEECKLKADFITKRERPFKLIETILWQPNKGYFLLKSHLERLFLSAEYFGFRCDRGYIIRRLKDMGGRFKEDSRVRLLLDREGEIEISFSKLDKDAKVAKARFSDKKVSSVNRFLYHKTTNRTLYDEEYKRWRDKGYFDVIFRNEKNQVTEGSISNIIIKKNGCYYSPALECGLLNGIFRQHLFRKKDFPLKEKLLYKKDINHADEVYMVNSVRGMVKVRL